MLSGLAQLGMGSSVLGCFIMQTAATTAAGLMPHPGTMHYPTVGAGVGAVGQQKQLYDIPESFGPLLRLLSSSAGSWCSLGHPCPCYTHGSHLLID